MGGLWRALVFGLVIGLMFGLGVGWFWGESSGKKKASPRPKPKPKDKTPCPPQREESPTVGLVVKREGNTVKVRLDGVQYRTYAAMPYDSRQRLLTYLKLVRDWMQIAPASAAGKGAAAPRKRAPAASAASLLDEEEISKKSIAEQIDFVLQKLAAKEGKGGVRIVPSLTGGVNIVVGKERYESVDDIPDEEVRALVTRAVKLWEKSTGR